ncbi:ABC transporter substrate-binding protein [Variovorax sp. ZT5P49]|uniref:ABC transporter substrate-binding protein n=1 Tax=Variovorax sp. ZT5P49 TaxID=3443733 RepID=UPI003F46CFC2
MTAEATATRRRALRIMGAGAAALAAAPWASPAQRAEADTEILIGQSCQLSGPLAPLTREIQEGAAWCFEQVNAKGGVHGRQIRLVALDDAYDPKRTAENVRQLIEKNGVFALFNLAGTPTTLAALPVLREHKVPLIAPFTGTDALRSSFDKYVFNVRAGYADEIEKIVQHLSVLGIDRVGVAYLNNSFGTGGLDAVKSATTKRGVALAAATPLEIDGSGLREAAQDLARSRPPVIILATAGKVTSDFIAAYQSSGSGAQFYALSVVSSQQLIQALGDRSKGVAIAQVMPYPWGSGTRLARELSDLASRKAVEVGYNHMEGFVSAKVLVEGLQQAGPSPTRESLVRGLEGLRELDLGGYVVRFSDRNHNGSNYVELTIVGASKRVLR